MADNQSQTEHDAVRESVIRGDDIHNEVRNIVVDALTHGKMEPEHIREVVRSVVQGALAGAAIDSQRSREALQETLNGVDDALTQVAQASRLAIEEAARHVETYSEHDLKRALNDLKDLEALFLQTLTEVATAGQETVYGILRDLLQHTRQSSTSVGRNIAQTLDHLQNLLAGSRANFHVADAAKASGASVARIASGFLAGIADSLSSNPDKS